jgi:DNA modification methylase
MICWYKGSPGISSFIGFNDWEPHLVYGKPSKQMHDYFAATPTPHNTGHPCPKPKKWAEWLVSHSTLPDEIILDPFIGSGTTAEACIKLGRHFLGFDISEKYCQIARELISITMLQRNLFRNNKSTVSETLFNTINTEKQLKIKLDKQIPPKR